MLVENIVSTWGLLNLLSVWSSIIVWYRDCIGWGNCEFCIAIKRNVTIIFCSDRGAITDGIGGLGVGFMVIKMVHISKELVEDYDTKLSQQLIN